MAYRHVEEYTDDDRQNEHECCDSENEGVFFGLKKQPDSCSSGLLFVSHL